MADKESINAGGDDGISAVSEECPFSGNAAGVCRGVLREAAAPLKPARQSKEMHRASSNSDGMPIKRAHVHRLLSQHEGKRMPGAPKPGALTKAIKRNHYAQAARRKYP